jgi:hypothetical protein
MSGGDTPPTHTAAAARNIAHRHELLELPLTVGAHHFYPALYR